MKKVLIVEDDQDLRNLTTLLLSKKIPEYSFFEAENGKEALEVLTKNEDINVVITDINMPEMNGEELINELALNNFDGEIIVVTGLAENNKLKQNKGVSHFFKKPADIDEIIKILK